MWSRYGFVVRALSLVLLLGLGRTPARAEASADDQRARAHFIAGESHFAAGRWADAVREFTLAYELSQRPEMLINRSRAYERDGQLDQARSDLTLLLERHPDTRYRVEAETRLERMERQRAMSPASKLAEQPAPTRVAEQPARAREAEQPAPVREAEPAPGPVAAPSAPAAVELRTRGPSWPVLALGGGALIAGAVALGTGLRAHALHSDLERDCRDDLCPAARAGDRDRGRSLARTSTGLTFAAAALLGGAVSVYVWERRRIPRVGVDVQADARGAAVRLRARF